MSSHHIRQMETAFIAVAVVVMAIALTLPSLMVELNPLTKMTKFDS
jgi:hypothetical protein